MASYEELRAMYAAKLNDDPVEFNRLYQEEMDRISAERVARHRRGKSASARDMGTLTKGPDGIYRPA